ncbi:hypothetical protein D9757_011058 [Collybiopsis confluens]|uniref:Uncharacterized protein n=1 Tax=Collybiopsis confluens TaxID=2823264 RepID=A0A8H5LT77_9AGAR|nr:hypothetical protein D9757_011058 [Collybiopsis confluens]
MSDFTVGRVRPVRDFNVRDALAEREEGVEARRNSHDHPLESGGGRQRPNRDIGVREADLSKGRPRPARDVIPVLEEARDIMKPIKDGRPRPPRGEARPRPARDLILERDEIEARDRGDVSSSVGHGPPRSRPHNN